MEFQSITNFFNIFTHFSWFWKVFIALFIIIMILYLLRLIQINIKNKNEKIFLYTKKNISLIYLLQKKIYKANKWKLPQAKWIMIQNQIDKTILDGEIENNNNKNVLNWLSYNRRRKKRKKNAILDNVEELILKKASSLYNSKNANLNEAKVSKNDNFEEKEKSKKQKINAPKRKYTL